MNVQIRRLGIGLLACYLALFVMLNWIQVVHKDALDNNALNDLRVKQLFNKDRGSISTADGAVVAKSVAVTGSSDFAHQRVYPQGALFGQLTGFYSFNYGSSGLELTYDKQLTGRTISQQIRSFADILNPRPQVGNLTISVRKDLQTLAQQALGNRAGSVVVTDPRTGALLAFWSYPSYDPNPISSLDNKVSSAAWTADNAAPGKPMLAKQYQEIYPPGSTFKIVTSSTGVQDGLVTVTHPVYPVARFYQPAYGKPIHNFGNEACGGTLVPILAVSCNSAFAQMGTETIGPEKMTAGAQAFGFDQKPPIDLPNPAASQFPTSFTGQLPLLGQASIGQNGTRATPLQMALVGSAIADGGVIMKPHVMTEVRDSEGNLVEQYHPSPWLTPISPQTAQTIHDAMMQVVAHGTATGMQLPGFDVGAKTGTAEVGLVNAGSSIDAWMVAFAGPKGQAPTVAVSVVVLDQTGDSEATGAQVAGPIAKQMLQATLAVQAAGH